MNPFDHALPDFRRRMFLGFPGWHLGCLKLLEDEFPLLMISNDFAYRRIKAEVQIRLRLLLAVAGDAVGFDERPHRAAKAALEINLVGVRRVQGVGEQTNYRQT